MASIMTVFNPNEKDNRRNCLYRGGSSKKHFNKNINCFDHNILNLGNRVKSDIEFYNDQLYGTADNSRSMKLQTNSVSGKVGEGIAITPVTNKQLWQFVPELNKDRNTIKNINTKCSVDLKHDLDESYENYRRSIIDLKSKDVSIDKYNSSYTSPKKGKSYIDDVSYYNKCAAENKKQKLILEKEKEKLEDLERTVSFTKQLNAEIEQEEKVKYLKIKAEQEAIEISKLNELLAKRQLQNESKELEVIQDYFKAAEDYRQTIELRKERERIKKREKITEQMKTFKDKVQQRKSRKINKSFDAIETIRPYEKMQRQRLLLEQLELDHEKRKLAQDQSKIRDIISRLKNDIEMVFNTYKNRPLNKAGLIAQKVYAMNRK